MDGHWLENSWFSDAKRDESGFEEITDWIESGLPELDLGGMNWKGSGDSNYFDTSDANLSFGGASVKGVIIKGKLVRQSDGTITIEAIVEFQATDNYDFEKYGLANFEPLFAGLAVGAWLTPAALAALEKAGGAKQFAVASEPWKLKISGEIMDRFGVFLDGEFTWKEIPWRPDR